jgi:hypothetical protein
VSSILHTTAIFISSFAFLLVLRNTLVIFHFAAAFQRQQKSMALKGHCETVLDIFISQALLQNCLRKSERFFSRNSAPRNGLRNRPPIFHGRFPATENSLCETAIQPFEFRGGTLVVRFFPMVK